MCGSTGTCLIGGPMLMGHLRWEDQQVSRAQPEREKRNVGSRCLQKPHGVWGRPLCKPVIAELPPSSVTVQGSGGTLEEAEFPGKFRRKLACCRKGSSSKGIEAWSHCGSSRQCGVAGTQAVRWEGLRQPWSDCLSYLGSWNYRNAIKSTDQPRVSLDGHHGSHSWRPSPVLFCYNLMELYLFYIIM